MVPNVLGPLLKDRIARAAFDAGYRAVVEEKRPHRRCDMAQHGADGNVGNRASLSGLLTM